jgi:hypothetical protein
VHQQKDDDMKWPCDMKYRCIKLHILKGIHITYIHNMAKYRAATYAIVPASIKCFKDTPKTYNFTNHAQTKHN